MKTINQNYTPRLVYLVLITGCALLSGCVFPVTRTVEDVYTKTQIDSTITTALRNQPGSRSGGVIYPSDRIVSIERKLEQKDSIVRRDYPAFIRYGLFESIGLIGSAPSGEGIGTGLFGVFYDPRDLLARQISRKSNVVFGGGLYRFGIFEYRLRWFRDAPDWTIGTTLNEIIYPQAATEKTVGSLLPLYLRKRFYIREEIPAVCLTAAAGIGWYPSQYINVSGSLDVGSIAGLNLRAYLGFVAGMNAPETTFNEGKTTSTVAAPYAGLGISLMDFMNRPPELDIEWKNHEHSGWNIGVAHIGAFLTNSDSSFFGSGVPIKGMQIALLPASVALPWFNHRLYAGTSLANLFVAGGIRQSGAGSPSTQVSIGLGILPLRVGYWQPVLLDELSLEPFVEYSYFPSSMLQIGSRLNLYAARALNISFNLGYITSDGFDTSSDFFRRNFGRSLGAFSSWYAGISVGLLDRIFFEDELRYNRRLGEP